MKKIAEIKDTWDAAPPRKKDALVAKACGWKFGKNDADHPEPLWLNKNNAYMYLPHYTTDPAATLQAMKDVGMDTWDIRKHAAKEYSVQIWEWWSSGDEDIIKNCKDLSYLFHPTLELACAFAAYAFSELRDK